MKRKAREREIRLGAEDYADQVLGTLETNLDKFLSAVQRGRERLQRPERGHLGQGVARARGRGGRAPWE